MQYIHISDEACVQLQMGIKCDSDCIVPEEHMEAAIKFGVEEIEGTDVLKYIVAFMRKLLLQRVKVKENVLENYLSPAVAKQWQEILSTLEDKNRKLINIQSGSLIFLLFCPTRKSKIQLQDENWRIEIQNKMAKLLKLPGKFYLAEMNDRDKYKGIFTLVLIQFAYCDQKCRTST